MFLIHILPGMTEPVDKDVVIYAAADPVRLLIFPPDNSLLPGTRLHLQRRAVIDLRFPDPVYAIRRLRFEIIPIETAVFYGKTHLVRSQISGKTGRPLLITAKAHFIDGRLIVAVIADHGTYCMDLSFSVQKQAKRKRFA